MAKAQWAKQLKDDLVEQFAQLEILIQPKNIVLSGVREALGQLNQQLAGLALNIGNAIGNAIGEGFSAAFTKGSGKSFFEAAGNALLSGIGGIVVQLGGAMLTYGLLMAAGLPLLLATPFAGQALSAPAAIAAGTGLIALGTGLGAIASANTGTRTGGAVARGASQSRQPEAETRQVVLDPDRRLREARQVAPQVNVREGAKATTAAPVTNHFVVIGANDPKVQRDIGDIVERAIRRNLIPSLA